MDRSLCHTCQKTGKMSASSAQESAGLAGVDLSSLRQERIGRFDAQLIETLLGDLVEALDSEGIELDAVIVGGAAMALGVRPDREETTDIDVFATINDDAKAVIARIARARSLPVDWFNAKAMMFGSPVTAVGLPVRFEKGDVRLRLLDNPSLLAMKLRAGRLSKDGDDIIALFDALGLSSVQEAEDVVDNYYDGEEMMSSAAKTLLEYHINNRP